MMIKLLHLLMLSLVVWDNRISAFTYDQLYQEDPTDLLFENSEDDFRNARALGFNFFGGRRTAPFSGALPFPPSLSSMATSSAPVYSDNSPIFSPFFQNKPRPLNFFRKPAPQNPGHNPRNGHPLQGSASNIRGVKPPPTPSVYRPAALSSIRYSKDKFLKQQHSTYSPASLESGFTPIINGNRASSSKVIHEVKPPSQLAKSKSTPFGKLQTQSSHTKVIFSKPQPPAPLLTVPAEILPKVTSTKSINQTKKDEPSPFYIPSVSSSVSSRVVVGGVSHRFENLKAEQSSRVVTIKKSSSPLLECDGSKDLGWCDLGSKYPKVLTQQVLIQCKDIVSTMYVEVPHSFDKLSDSSDFRSELDNSSARERGSHESWSWASYNHQGSLCDAETGFLRPEAARDSTGRWNLVIQTEEVRQRVPIEMCRKTNSSCKKVPDCGLKSQCLQKYNYHLLLSLDPNDLQGCPAMRLYKFPSACVCHVQQ